jgi:hypothetical protein
MVSTPPSFLTTANTGKTMDARSPARDLSDRRRVVKSRNRNRNHNRNRNRNHNHNHNLEPSPHHRVVRSPIMDLSHRHRVVRGRNHNLEPTTRHQVVTSPIMDLSHRRRAVKSRNRNRNHNHNLEPSPHHRVARIPSLGTMPTSRRPKRSPNQARKDILPIHLRGGLGCGERSTYETDDSRKTIYARQREFIRKGSMEKGFCCSKSDHPYYLTWSIYDMVLMMDSSLSIALY